MTRCARPCRRQASFNSFYTLMMMQLAQTLLRMLGLILLLGALAGCSTSFESLVPDRRVDYRESKLTNRLEVPPDLTSSTIDDTLAVPEINPTGTAKFSAYAGERTSSGQVKAAETVLQTQPDIQIERDGNRRWLLVQHQSPEQLWPKVKEFWTSNGLILKQEDPRIGVMETGWAENRADIPSGVIRDVLSKFIDFAYSAPTRDKFRVRLERVDDGTAIYLTHYGVEEVTRGDTVGKDKSTSSQWQSRPPDPELEAEMLNRLMVYLGASEKRAAAQLAKSSTAPAGSRARLTTVDGQQAVVINDNYARAWRWVGLALDSSNFVVEDQNRAQGKYVVEYRDLAEEGSQPGFFSKLAFWKESPPPKGTRYQVRLAGQGAQTTVVVQNAGGQPDNSPAAKQLLQALVDAIK
jgi:outer membrane protein assembly factor BamC